LVVSEKPASEQDSIKRLLGSFDASGIRVDDDFSALGYAATDRTVTKAPPPAAPSYNWLAWIDVRGTDFSRNSFGSDLNGTQANAIAGLARKLTPNFLVGVLVGYEHFDYSSQAFNGVLKGDGWTVGSYLGWKIVPTLRFDVTAAYSSIGFDGVAGSAQGNFSGSRWLLSSGLTGFYKFSGFDIEPSAKIYGLWENENAYTDSLGTQQGVRQFITGRSSDGVQVTYPFDWKSSITLMPYAGLYGDYYFNNDNVPALAGVVPLASTPILSGWSARATAGLSARFSNGVMTMIGGEYGGIGSNTQIWTFRGRASVPF
jgi:hypothetical protein